MTNKEIALQLTLKAMELKCIPFHIPRQNHPDAAIDPTSNDVNTFNAELVFKFYNSILAGIQDDK